MTRPVVVVSVDGVRRDAWHHLRSVADAPGCEYDSVVVGGSWTVPSHTCLFTGQGPWRHDWKGEPPRRTRARLSHPTFMAQLQRKGYATAFWGADLLRNCRPKGEEWGGPGEGGATADGRADDILDFMRSTDRYGLLLHYWGSHAPYGLDYAPLDVGKLLRHAENRAIFREAYVRSLTRIDGELSRVLAQARADDAVVLVTTDHGEDFGEGHPMAEQFTFLWTHCVGWRPEVVVVRSKLIDRDWRARVPCLVRNYDLIPTLWRVAFGEEFPGADGVPALPGDPGGRIGECHSTEWGMTARTVVTREAHAARLDVGGHSMAWYPGEELTSDLARYSELYERAKDARPKHPAATYDGVQERQMLRHLSGLGYL